MEEKKSHVIRLDLQNAYGSVPHKLIEKVKALAVAGRIDYLGQHGISLCWERVKPLQFRIAGEQIPMMADQPVKSLGRWYAITLTDHHRGVEVQSQLEEELRVIG